MDEVSRQAPAPGVGRALVPPALAWGMAALALLALVLLYRDTARGLFATWQTSDTYSHCIAVLPVVGWMLWRMRARLAALEYAPWLPAAGVLAALSVVWLAGSASNIKSLQDLALVASVPVMLVLVLGRQFATAAAFPLAVILFAWPFGEVLIPPMINATADFTVRALRLTGVPVFRDGNSFVIPTGTWSVVHECSGIRYLLVSLFACTVFAYFNFRSPRRRLAFMALSIAVPLVANWLRAYLVVLLGHLSNNRIAVGVDHLIYGWVFFGAVITALFYVGGFWMQERDSDGASAPANAPAARRAKPAGARRGVPGFAAAILAGLAATAFGPLWAMHLERSAPPSIDVSALALPERVGAWVLDPAATAPDWKPRFEGPSWQAQASYVREGRSVSLHMAVWDRQREGAKIGSFSTDALADFDATWRALQRAERQAGVPADQWTVLERLMSSFGSRRLAWEWNWVAGDEVSGLLATRARIAALRLRGAGEAAVRIVIDTSVADDPDAARAALEDFAREVRDTPRGLLDRESRQ